MNDLEKRILAHLRVQDANPDAGFITERHRPWFQWEIARRAPVVCSLAPALVFPPGDTCAVVTVRELYVFGFRLVRWVVSIEPSVLPTPAAFATSEPDE